MWSEDIWRVLRLITLDYQAIRIDSETWFPELAKGLSDKIVLKE